MRSITARDVANKLIACVRHEIELKDLVDWAEQAMMEGDFDEKDYEAIRDIVSQLAVADVKAFGLTWDDCEDFLNRLGYEVRVEVIPEGAGGS